MDNKQKYQNLLASSTVSVNGSITDAKDAKISIFDRGFLYGDSIYEVLYTKNRTLVFLKEHLERLYHSANLLNMQLYFSEEELISQIMATLKASKIDDAYVRIVITRGESEISLNPMSSFKNNIVIIAKPVPIYPEKFYSDGQHLNIVSIERNNIKSTNPNAKSGNYLNNVMASGEAKNTGADDALMINAKGNITEGPTFNIWMIKDGIVHTPPVDSGILKGITRDKIIDLCHKHCITIKTDNFTPETIFTADEVFITSSTRGIIPVRRINNHTYGANIADWPITSKLSNFYLKLIQDQISEGKLKY